MSPPVNLNYGYADRYLLSSVALVANILPVHDVNGHLIARLIHCRTFRNNNQSVGQYPIWPATDVKEPHLFIAHVALVRWDGGFAFRRRRILR